ncbi:MAG: AAA domain-containing protein [Nostoc sp.]|uniref:DEAD/DEAH box helicase n=1 Tax=Nostoc sp. TaxID=1180 RepID=UPI002FFBB9C8
MRVSDIQYGRVYNLEIEQVNREAFQGKDFLNVNNELFLYQSVTTGEILLKHGTEDIWEIRGINKNNQNSLIEIIERKLPILCWLVSSHPKPSPKILTIQIREFPQYLKINEEIHLGIDEKIIEDIRDRHIRKNLEAEKIIKWLKGQFFILPTLSEDGYQRALFQAGNNAENGLQTTFCLCANERTVNIRRTTEDKLIIDKIEKFRQAKNQNEQRPVIIIEAKLNFCDISLIKQLRQTARNELDIIVENSNSYLGLWNEYNNLEIESIRKKVQEFEWLKYSNSRLLYNGSYRFDLIRNANIETKLKMLMDENNISLEASEYLPQLGIIDTNKNKVKPFLGIVENIDLYSLTIDVTPSNLDEDLFPPKNGFIYISLQGDIIRLSRRQIAEKTIRSAICPMPQLGLILENQPVPTRRIRQHKPLSPATKKLFNNFPTARQEEALKVAINTPDIVLIQGPPGTGKTKVISALQVRLAEISEDAGNSVSHRILLTSYQHDAVENAAEKSVVFGLPAVIIGGRTKGNARLDNVDRWRRSRIEALQVKLAQFPEIPESAILRQLRNLVASYLLAPGNLQETATLLKQVFELTKSKIRGELSDRLLEYSHRIAQGKPLQATQDSEERERVLKAAQAIRSNPITFSDDGPATAYKALRRLENLQVLEDSEYQLLEKAAKWLEEEAPPFLEELKLLRDRLIKKLIPQDITITTPIANPEIETLLNEVREEMYKNVRQSKAGVEAVLSEYLEDLETDPQGVREVLRKYTVVLAATCQQSSSKQMQFITESDNAVFETVIVDEAARANPLDLFIPMSKAERRIILVGDHRQLPHILEDDIEHKLGESRDATKNILKKSLFERLFIQMKEREKIDGIKRTVTLDTQYRMHPILGDFVSRTFYEYHGEPPIRAGRPEADFFHNLPGYENTIAAWINVPLTAGKETSGKSKTRPIAKVIAQELKKLIEHNTQLSFGIIAFYAAQVTEIWKALCEVNIAERTEEGIYEILTAYKETRNHEGKIVEKLRIGTVDAFQGKEFDVVFLSITRSNNIYADKEELYPKKYGFLMLENRLCVAMSRQKRLLIGVGDLGMVKTETAPKAIRELVSFYKLCQEPHGKVI